MLEIDDLHVWYDVPGGDPLHAVRGVSFDLEPGDRMGLVGESGCGKTTVLMALMALLPASATVSGDVRLNGASLLAAGEGAARGHRWKDIAVVFQGAMSAFNPVQTIERQIAEPMEVHGVAKGVAARNRARELLDLVGVAPSAGKRYPHEFSGGMRQRAMLAMALACDPKVLLADEPTTALDPMISAQVLELLTRLSESLGLALLLVTHDLPAVSQLCDRAAVMYAGQVVEAGELHDLYHEPEHPYTRLLYAATPDLADRDGEVVSIPGAPPRLDRPIEGCAFAPRCDVVLDRCPTQEPPVASAARRHARCWLAADQEVTDVG